MTGFTCRDGRSSTILSAEWASLRKQFVRSHNDPVRANSVPANVTPDGNGGSEGIALPMQLVYGGQSSVSYVVQLNFGNDDQALPLQVDTGSSDLVATVSLTAWNIVTDTFGSQWVASTSCPSSVCGSAKGKLYNPNSAQESGAIFNISYLSGKATGLVFWDKVTLGGYQINNQALGAVDSVASEPLDAFSGVLGLALPQNSIITSEIPASTGGNFDGAIFASNLFSIGNDAPAARFISLSLERPGSNKIPSMLGIGRHPSSVVSDPSTINYSSLFNDGGPQYFWKTSINAITVYVNGVKKDITLSSVFPSSVLPTAVLDTGVPVILATTAITNGIYGALGIGPSADGYFYVPCTTPLNMTITINDFVVPLHPLDLTQPTNQGPTSCLGLIQNANAALMQSNIGDLVLGIPFMRNVYTVLAFTPPSNGTFDTTTPLTGTNSDINPRLGLLKLTDPKVALEEFHTVRVLGQPLSGPGTNATLQATHHGLSIGLKVLIGLGSGFVFLIAIFAGWLLYHRRKLKEDEPKQDSTSDKVGMELSALRDTGSADLMRRKMMSSWTTEDSARTKVEEGEEEEELMTDVFGLVYFGRKAHKRYDSSGSSRLRYTLVGDDDLDSHRDSTHSAAERASDDRGFDTVYPSGAIQASSRLVLTSEPENETASPSPMVEFPNTEGNDEVRTMDLPVESMAGIGTRGRWMTGESDDFSVDAMSRLSSPASIFPRTQSNFKSVSP